MKDPIVTQEDVRERARHAFDEGRDLSDNPFPWNSAAYRTWSDEWLRLAAMPMAREPGASA